MAVALVDLARAARPDLAGEDTDGSVERALAHALADARAAWPGVAVSDAAFVAFAAGKLGEAPLALASVPAVLAELHVPDLYLVAGCIAGDTGAIAAFDRACSPVIERAVTASGARPAEVADLGQVVRARLLVAPAAPASEPPASARDADAETSEPSELGEPGAPVEPVAPPALVASPPPRIATYSGRGALGSWVRVVATREAARLLARERREVAADDDDLAGMVAPDDDPEVGYLKRLYRAEFKAAFAAAIGSLTDKERVLLRQHTLDGLSIDELAAFYRVHRATTARWLEAARAKLLVRTRNDLIARLELTRSELDSIMRLITSNLNVSLPNLLRSRK